MKKTFIVYYLLVLFLISVSTGLKSQDTRTLHAVERLQVCTDRTMYISGEKIFFSAVIFYENDINAIDYSRILYCELITPDGNRITGGKYPIDNSSSQACLQIPAETITGIYYLKSYTRFMRNGIQDNYHYIRMKVINPYKAEVLSVNEPEITSPYIPDKPDRIPIRVSPDKMIYHPRERIILKIEEDPVQDFSRKLSLTVIPVASWDSISAQGYSISPAGDSISPNLQYYPETRGISLSGRLLETGSGLPVPNALVNLSIIGDKDVMAIRTNASGQFYFTLPGYSGNRDIFLCGEDIPGISPAIYIDNDFCSRPVNLKTPEFHLTENERGTAYRLAVNQKLTSIFLNDTTSADTELPPETSFYGEPDEILVTDDYIDLPTLEEYFNELLGAVNVRKSRGKKHFRFNTTRPEMTIYDPLVLIDWVAVDDIDRILAMSPKEIDRIELVNSPYIKGNITYGGIISFVSKNKDYAGIDLPASGIFINYKFLDECSGNIPSGPLPDNLPDSRNTIYWDPDFKTDESGSTDIFFTVPGTPGKYIILLYGMSISGKGVSVSEVFEVVAD